MAITNLLRFVLHWSGYGEEGTVGFHVGGSLASHTPAELLAAIDQVDTNWGTDETPSVWTRLQGLLTAAQSYDSLALYEYAVDNEPATTQALKTISKVGTYAGSCLPLQVASVATLHTAISGRRYRGRIYLPARDKILGTNLAQMSSSSALAVATLAANMGSEVEEGIGTALSVADPFWGVYSRAGRVVTEITAVSADTILDVQRRRAASLSPTAVQTVTVA